MLNPLDGKSVDAGENGGKYYEYYLKALIKHNQFTEFAFEECARYTFHNVVKKHMGMGDDSVFQIDLKAIKVNPKYVEKLKQENDFFADEIDAALTGVITTDPSKTVSPKPRA